MEPSYFKRLKGTNGGVVQVDKIYMSTKNNSEGVPIIQGTKPMRVYLTDYNRPYWKVCTKAEYLAQQTEDPAQDVNRVVMALVSTKKLYERAKLCLKRGFIPLSLRKDAVREGDPSLLDKYPRAFTAANTDCNEETFSRMLTTEIASQLDMLHHVPLKYRYDAAITQTTTTQTTKETPMQHTEFKETTLINNKPEFSYSEDELIAMVTQAQTQIKTLETVGTESEFIKAKIMQYNEEIATLFKILDIRVPVKST